MAKGGKGRHRISSRLFRACPYASRLSNTMEDFPAKQCPKISEQKKEDWEEATCPVCMEPPHNAVLLLCSSHDNGCRPFMCATGHRHSNCLHQYKTAYTKTKAAAAAAGPANAELACPLCRGQVKGWTVVGPARECLNSKERCCTHEKCTFAGDYKGLRRHVRAEHAEARRPREVDPAAEREWRRLERERERDDVVSTIRSAMPGAVFFGDYVVEGNGGNFAADSDEDEDDEGGPGTGGGFGSNLVNVFLLLHAFGSSAGVTQAAAAGGGGGDVAEVSDDDDSDEDDDDDDDVSGGGDVSLASRLGRQGRVLLGRSGRRRRRRELNGGGGGGT